MRKIHGEHSGLIAPFRMSEATPSYESDTKINLLVGANSYVDGLGQRMQTDIK